jgi:hypothetical protein
VQIVATLHRHTRLWMLAAVVAAVALVTVGCSPGEPLASVPGLAGTHTVPASIPSNCSRDVTGDLLRWVASVGDGSVLQFTPGGCYRIDGTLRIQDRNNLTFEGNGATFKPLTDGTELGPSAARGRAQFFFVRGSNITLRNINVRGVRDLGLNSLGYSLEAQHAFVVGQTRGFHLDHVSATQVYGDFVYIGPYTDDVTVVNSKFDQSARMGWTINGGHNIVFTNNTVSNTWHSTINLEPPNTGSLDGLTIQNNVFVGGHLGFFNVGGAPGLTFANIRVLNNSVVNHPMKIQANPAGGSSIRNFVVSGNTVVGPVELTGVDQSGGGAFYFMHATGVTVTNNRVPMTWGRNITGVNLASSHDVVVTGNTWDGGSGSVSYFDGGSSNVCWTNNLIGPGQHWLEAPSNPTC